MARDYQAHYRFVGQPWETSAVDFLLAQGPAPESMPELADVADPLARGVLLAQALVGASKSYAQSGDRRTGRGGLTHSRTVGALNACFDTRWTEYLEPLGLLKAAPPLERLPCWSFLVTVPFVLDEPYLSKDDASFDIIENGIRKDRVFGLPVIAGSQWKGLLRSAATSDLLAWWRALDEPARATPGARRQYVRWRVELLRLFGSEKGVEDDDAPEKNRRPRLDEQGNAGTSFLFKRWRRRFGSGHLRGALHCFPTWFQRVGYSVINPHSRQSGAGESPILLEEVPAGTEGRLQVLHCCPTEAEPKTAALHIRLLARAISLTLTDVGIGAKTSSGFGAVRQQLPNAGTISVRVPRFTAGQPRSPEEPTLPEECKEFLVDGEFLMEKPLALKKDRGWSGSRVERYKRAKELFLRYQKGLAQRAVSPVPPVRCVRSWNFRSVAELVEAAEAAARDAETNG